MQGRGLCAWRDCFSGAKDMKTLKNKLSPIDTRKVKGPATERIRGYKLTQIRQGISKRDDYVCQMCGRPTAQGEVDHIVPLHMGGKEVDDNRQWLCRLCHAKKTAQEATGRENIGSVYGA